MIAVAGGAAGYFLYLLHVRANPPKPVPGDVAKQSVTEARRMLQGIEHAPATFFKLDPHSGTPESKKRGGPFLRDWTILQEKPLDATAADEVRSILTSQGSYSDTGAKCFEPGLGFRFNRRGSVVDFIVCLACRWIHACEGDQTSFWALSESGVDRLMGIYTKQTAADPK
jgi:hypothetical protein